MDIAFEGDNIYTVVPVNQLEEGDILNLEGDSVWDDDEYGELVDPQNVVVQDIYEEDAGDDDYDGDVWSLVLLNGDKEQIITLFGKTRLMRLSDE